MNVWTLFGRARITLYRMFNKDFTWSNSRIGSFPQQLIKPMLKVAFPELPPSAKRLLAEPLLRLTPVIEPINKNGPGARGAGARGPGLGPGGPGPGAQARGPGPAGGWGAEAGAEGQQGKPGPGADGGSVQEGSRGGAGGAIYWHKRGYLATTACAPDGLG